MISLSQRCGVRRQRREPTASCCCAQRGANVCRKSSTAQNKVSTFIVNLAWSFLGNFWKGYTILSQVSTLGVLSTVSRTQVIKVDPGRVCQRRTLLRRKDRIDGSSFALSHSDDFAGPGIGHPVSRHQLAGCTGNAGVFGVNVFQDVLLDGPAAEADRRMFDRLIGWGEASTKPADMRACGVVRPTSGGWGAWRNIGDPTCTVSRVRHSKTYQDRGRTFVRPIDV